jgi:dienelactone hydrolase
MRSRRDFLAHAPALTGFLGAVSSKSQVAKAERMEVDGNRPEMQGIEVLPLPSKTGSPLGSIWPVVERQASRLQFPLSFTQPGFRDIESWKKIARSRLEALLHYSPEPCDPVAQTVRRVELNGYVREDLSFQTAPGMRVPAALLIPTTSKGRLPGIVALHDHGGFYLWGREKILENTNEHSALTEFRKRYYGGKSIAAELARRGFVVLTIDMFYWGERRLILDNDPVDWRDRSLEMPADRVAEFNSRSGREEPFVARALMTAGVTWPGIMLWDDRRSLDYLASRPEVDPDRLGCVGLSVGGLRSMYLAAFDDRIKAAVICGWMASHSAQLKSHLRHSIGFTKLIPGMTELMDYPDVASLTMPSPLLVLHGSQDALFEPTGVQASFEKLKACYTKAGVPDRFRASVYEGPHQFDEKMQAEAWAWIDRWV